MSATPLLTATELTKHWPTGGGLAPTSFELHPGDILAVTGRSGSGKSTLLSIIAGLCDADSGTINRTGTWSDNQHWRRWSATAFVPQVLALFDELTAQEHLDLVLRLAPTDSHTLDAADLLERLDLTAQAGHTPNEMSLGQQQRLAVARAVIASPTIVLADEPTSHQDPHHAELVLNTFVRLADSGGAIVLTGHQPSIRAVASKGIELR